MWVKILEAATGAAPVGLSSPEWPSLDYPVYVNANGIFYELPMTPKNEGDAKFFTVYPVEDCQYPGCGNITGELYGRRTAFCGYHGGAHVEEPDFECPGGNNCEEARCRYDCPCGEGHYNNPFTGYSCEEGEEGY